MVKLNNIPSFQGFVSFIREKQHLKEILIFSGIYLIFYFIFTNLYILPSTLTDSANYVYCAYVKQPGGYRPYGYSWFLDFIHSFYSSIRFVTVTQFLLTALSTFFFTYSIKYFFRIKSGWLWYVSLFIIVSAPPTLYMAHSLLSDSLFCSLTIIWLTAGLWVLFTRNLAMYALHLVSLFWALEVRYTGLFYPAFTILIVLFTFDKFTYKLGLIALCLLVSVYFYKSTKSEMKQIFGVDTFSGFSGWQLASNALHVVPHVKLEPKRARDPQTKMFLEFINQTDKSFYDRGVSAHFMWHKQSPLKHYAYWKMETMRVDYLRSWLLCGKDFSKFGTYLIKKYPDAFFTHYILPNIWNVLYPPPDKGAISRVEDITTDDLFHEYYKLEKGIKFSEGRSTLFITLAPYLSAGNLLLWLGFMGAIVMLVFQWKKLVKEKVQFYGLLYLILFAIGYAGFNAFAGPFEYRYIIPIRPILVALPMLAFILVILPDKFLKKV